MNDIEINKMEMNKIEMNKMEMNKMEMNKMEMNKMCRWVYMWRSIKLDRTWMTVICVQCIVVRVKRYELV